MFNRGCKALELFCSQRSRSFVDLQIDMEEIKESVLIDLKE
jgi:hypothetical protein